MATEAKSLTRRTRVRGTVAQLFSDQTSAMHKVGLGSGIAAGTGVVIAGGALLERAVAPELSSAVSAVMSVGGPTAMPAAIAAGAGVMAVNGLMALNVLDDDHRANRYGRTSDIGRRRAGFATNARARNRTIARVSGIAALVAAGAVGASATGLDVTGIIGNGAAHNLAEAAEIIGAVGVSSMATSGIWHRSQARHSELSARSLGE